MNSTEKKNNETKNSFFKKEKKIDKTLARLRKTRDESNKIRNKRGDIATDTTEIQKIIRTYYGQLHFNKLDNKIELPPSFKGFCFTIFKTLLTVFLMFVCFNCINFYSFYTMMDKFLETS